MSKIELKHLLIGLSVCWAIGCIASRGPAILAYILMQAGTSGLFAWAIAKSLRKNLNTEATETVLQLNQEPVEPARPQLQTTQAG